MSRTIIITVEIPDNDLNEIQLYNKVSSWSCFKDFKVLPDTKELYENDKHFRTMVLNRKRLTEQIEKYIQYKRHG